MELVSSERYAIFCCISSVFNTSFVSTFKSFMRRGSYRNVLLSFRRPYIGLTVCVSSIIVSMIVRGVISRHYGFGAGFLSGTTG